MLKTRKLSVVQLILPLLIAMPLAAAAPETPKVDKVLPASPSALADAPGVFFREDFETLTDLSERFHDLSTDYGNFGVTSPEGLSGFHSLRQTYRPLTDYAQGEDPGNAGWVWRSFGDNPFHQSRIPDDQKGKYTTIVANWYHKFPQGFTPRDGTHFPPKMARLKCFTPGDWSGMYTVLFWISGEDGHISIERRTKVPAAHREWQPNFATNFRFSDPVNVGRWIHFELRVSLGEGTRNDRVQAWADGLLICDIAGDDLAAGYRQFTPNGMSLDCYWNSGSPVEQNRYYDDYMLGTERIGPLRTGLNPTIVKLRFRGGVSQGGWEAEVAQGVQREPVKGKVLDGVVLGFRELEVDYNTVWRGALEGAELKLQVDTANGEFAGPRDGETTLAANTLHFVRVRQKNPDGEWSPWSSWHSGFATDWAAGTPPELRTLPAGYLAEASASVLGLDDTPPEIRNARGPVGAIDTAGPYTVTADLIEENPLNFYVYYRYNGAGDYVRVPMNLKSGDTFEGEIPGAPAGTLVEYYVRALDGFEHYTYIPADYQSNPLRFQVQDMARWDLNGDGLVGAGDLLKLLLAGRRNPDDPALDYDGDGSFGVGDLLAFLRGMLGGEASMLAGIVR